MRSALEKAEACCIARCAKQDNHKSEGLPALLQDPAFELEEAASEREGEDDAGVNGTAAPGLSPGGGSAAPAGSAEGGADSAGPALTEAERLQFVYRCQLQLRLPDEAGALLAACESADLPGVQALFTFAGSTSKYVNAASGAHARCLRRRVFRAESFSWHTCSPCAARLSGAACCAAGLTCVRLAALAPDIPAALTQLQNAVVHFEDALAAVQRAPADAAAVGP